MSSGPLNGATVAAATWPAAAVAGRLLEGLGAARADNSAENHLSTTAVTLGGSRVQASPSLPADDWAATGVASLTGRPDGESVAPAGAPATVARGLALAIAAGGGPALDGPALLGMRVGALPLSRGGDRSANGSAQLLRAADGWIALNLPRRSDREMIPALLERPVGGDVWPALRTWVATRAAEEVVDRGALLGLPVSRVGESRRPEWPWRLTPVETTAAATGTGASSVRVVNLGALWAAPLSAQILHRNGWAVTDVSTRGRPEAPVPGMASVLHAGHDQLVLDLGNDHERGRLRGLLEQADVVIEASRPRALRQLGLDAETVMDGGRRQTWLRITGYGPNQERAALGDDAAAAGGLVAWDEAGPMFAGDAIADPLTGLTAALVAIACHRDDRSWIADLPLARVAAWAAAA